MRTITVTRYRLTESTTTLDVRNGFDLANEDHRAALTDTLDAVEVEGCATASYMTVEPAETGQHIEGQVDDDEITVDPDADDPVATWGTWTYIGHWDSGQLVIDFTADGEVADYREDDGYWTEGLFAETVSAPTEAESLQILIDRYADDED